MSNQCITKPLRLAFILPFFLLVFVGLMVPSDGNHGILSIKSLAFLSTVFSICAYFFLARGIRLCQFKLILFFLSFVSLLLLWGILASFQEEFSSVSTIDQFKIFILTLSVVMVAAYYDMEGMIDYRTILKVVVYSNFFYSLIKVALVALYLAGFINIWDWLEKMGIRFMSMGIIGGLPRLQTSTDIPTPYLLFFFLQASTFNVQWTRRFKMVYFPVTILSIFLSFSRYLMAIALLSLFLHSMTARFRTIIKAITLVFIAVLIGIMMIGPDTVYQVIEKRLFSKDNYVSDRTRIEQIEDLTEEYLAFPWLGKGLGGYTKKNIRDTVILHSYEVQWSAFIMQFGLIGILCIFAAVGILCGQLIRPPITRQKIGFFLLFIAWLLSGMTNPFLISLTSGIIYMLFLLTARQLQLNTREFNKHLFLPLLRTK